MGFLDKLFKPRGLTEQSRDTVIHEIFAFQLALLRVLSPNSIIGLPSTNFLASAAMGAIISTTPGRSPEQKQRDLTELMPLLIYAIDDTVEEQTPEEQAEFKTNFQARWNDYFEPSAYVLGAPDRYLELDRLLVHRLADNMGFEPTILEATQIDLGLQEVIRTTANRIWPSLR